MDQCFYEPVNKDIVKVKSEERNKNKSWKPFLRQMMVCSGVCNTCFLTGLCFGSPTVIIPQLRREANSTEAVSEEMASWISSVHGFAAIPWFLLPILSCKIGRKYPFFLVGVISFISYIGLYCSSTPTQILISEIFLAPLFACQITIAMSVIIEYTSLNYRGVFLALPSASGNWGIWEANALGTFFHWKTIAVTGIVCSLYNLFTIPFWCESPSWLASNNKYKECARAHRWMKGENIESELELEALIKSCQEHQEKQNMKNKTQSNFWIRSYITLLERSFYMPLILSIAMLSLIHTSGKLVCSVYAIEIIKKITSTESTAYTGMLLLDAVTVVGMYAGSGLSKCVRRKTLLLTGSSGGTIFHFILAVYLFSCQSKAILENHYVVLTLLSLLYLFISVGPMILSFTIYGEIMPLRHRTAGMFIIGLWTDIFNGITLKTAPQMFKAFELHGAFLFYGVTSLAIILFLYKFLPETKDKTLQEIEKYFARKITKEELLEVPPIDDKLLNEN